MSQWIYTVATGKPKYGAMALGLGRSLRHIGDRTPRAIYTDIEGPWETVFDRVIRTDKPRSALDKLRALDYLDGDQVLAIDCDALAFRPVQPVFDELQGRPFVVQGDPQTSGVWHGADVAEICQKFGVESIPRFNGGLLYYERSPEFGELYRAMHEFEANYASLPFAAFRGNASEEVCILMAMLETKLGEAVPDATDYQSTAVGLIGKLHMDIRKPECEFLCRRERVRFIRPYIFHASRFVNYLVYWRQIKYLEQIFQ